MNQIEWMQRKIEALTKRVNDLSTLDKSNRLNAWQPIFQAASYVSATSILFTGADLTAYLSGYVKCRWYQSSWRYGYVASSSFGSGNTTATLVSNTSYSVANAAITNFSISYGNPTDFPNTLNWDPTISTTMGYSGLSFVFRKFSVSNGICSIWFRCALTLSGTASNEVKFTFPIPASMGNSFFPAGSGMINFLIANSAGADNTYGTIRPISGNYSLGATTLFSHMSYPIA